MRICSQQLRRSEGSALLVSLISVLVLTTSLFSYLTLVEHQNRAVYRSEAWNHALAVAEAGVEEALAQMNPGAVAPAVNFAANGWGGPSGSVYGPVTRTFTNGADISTYSVAITGGTFPVINSTGSVYVASLASTITRAVRVTAQSVPLFSAAVAAKTNVSLGGNNMFTDSFDSADPTHSTNGGRYSSALAKTNGDVASMWGLVSVGNSDIHGDLYLGPNATYDIKNNGSISGTTYYDYNYLFPAVAFPDATGWPDAAVVNTNIGGTTFTYAFFTAGGKYKIPSDGNIYIAPEAAGVTLYMNTDFSSNIKVATNNLGSGSVTNYMNGQSFTVTGNNYVDGGLAKNFTYFGSSNNTSITFSGNAAFTGTIYAPYATITLNGGGHTTYDIVGAIVAKDFDSNGHFSVHFDEDLLNSSPPRGYEAASWTEL